MVYCHIYYKKEIPEKYMEYTRIKPALQKVCFSGRMLRG
jgi:hypothetical protein